MAYFQQDVHHKQRYLKGVHGIRLTFVLDRKMIENQSYRETGDTCIEGKVE